MEVHSWKNRRRFMFVVIAFCMLIILGAVFLKPNGAASATAIIAAFGTISATLGSYVFGATWDDKNKNTAEAENFRAVTHQGKGEN